MRIRALAALIGLGVLTFVGIFIWGAFRTPGSLEGAAGRDAPTAAVSDTLSDGRIDAQVYALGNREIRLEIQFTPSADAVESAGMRPTVNFAMADMDMDEFDPPLELVQSGVWRAKLQLPMAGRWVVNVGFADDFAKVEFDSQ